MLVEHRTENQVKERLILALDTDDPDRAMDMVDLFRGRVGLFKVGLQLFTLGGTDFIRAIRAKGPGVFLDLKFHDIPNTVAAAVVEAARLGVRIVNVHATGGAEMMKASAEALVRVCLKENLERPRLIAVTVLTSLGQEVLEHEIGVPRRIDSYVRHLASLALRSGLDGVVASPREISMIKDQCGEGFLVITPGIRPPWAPPDDQKRTMTPKQALMEGADYLVIGRAVTPDKDPDSALNRLIEESIF